MESEQIYYLYTDENNIPLYRQARYYKNGEKNFYSERFVDNKWESGLKDVPRVLYKLPSVINGVKNSQTIYIVEGEKDVETLLSKKKIATTIARWSKSEVATKLLINTQRC